jgi:flagellar FliJ protein
MSGSSSTRRSPTGPDRGLQAVARVRAVRERDSRAGLLRALTNLRTREAELTARREALAEASARTFGSLAEFAAARPFLETTAEAVLEAQRRLTASTTVATEARSRWQSDKTRVRAIEHLLEVRAEQARAAALHAEAREIDDIVGGRRDGNRARRDALGSGHGHDEGGHA